MVSSLLKGPLELALTLCSFTSPGYDPTQSMTGNATAQSRLYGYYANSFTFGFFNPDETYLYLAVTDHRKADGTPQNISVLPSYGYIGVACINIAVSPPQPCPTQFYQLGTDLLFMANGAEWGGPGVGKSNFNMGKSVYVKVRDNRGVAETSRS